MTEDVAYTTWLAMQIGTPVQISPEQVAQLHRRYQTCYGQPESAPTTPSPLPANPPLAAMDFAR
jgi:hypothetical protein